MALDLMLVGRELDSLDRQIADLKANLKVRKEYGLTSRIVPKLVKEDIKSFESQHKALKAYLNTIAKFV